MPPINEQRVLVIGGAGFIGQHTANAFQESGAKVTIFDISEPPASLADLDFNSGSVTELGKISEAAKGCDTVVFLANASLPATAHTDLADEVETHVHSTIKAAETCSTAGVSRFIYASSGGTVYGAEPDQKPVDWKENASTIPCNAYGVSKLTVEHYLRILGNIREMQPVSLRISNPYGEGQSAHRGQGFVAAAMQRAHDGAPLEIWGDGSVIRDFIHVSDVARAFVAAAEGEIQDSVFNIGSGQGVSLRDMIALIETATDRKIEIDFHRARNIDVPRNVLNVELAREKLGWSPLVGFEEGLQRTADWWQTKWVSGDTVPQTIK